MAFGAHIFGRFILFSKSCIGQFLTILWSVHGMCVWPVFTVCVWTVYCANMLDYVLTYVDICVFRYIDMDGCKLYM